MRQSSSPRPPQEKDWQREFDKIFVYNDVARTAWRPAFAIPVRETDSIKSFISQVIQQAEYRVRAEEAKLCEQKILSLDNSARTQAQKELLGKIEKMIEVEFGKSLAAMQPHEYAVSNARKLAEQILNSLKPRLLTELKTLQ